MCPAPRAGPSLRVFAEKLSLERQSHFAGPSPARRAEGRTSTCFLSQSDAPTVSMGSGSVCNLAGIQMASVQESSGLLCAWALPGQPHPLESPGRTLTRVSRTPGKGAEARGLSGAPGERTVITSSVPPTKAALSGTPAPPRLPHCCLPIVSFTRMSAQMGIRRARGL